MRNVVFSPDAFEQYQYWQEHDKAILRKLNQLLRECQRDPFKGTGKPEALKGNLAGRCGWFTGSMPTTCTSVRADFITTNKNRTH